MLVLKLKLIGSLLGLFLTGCASNEGIGRALTYPSKYTVVDTATGGYWVFEHQKDKTLMTGSSPGRAFGAGAIQGASLGLAKVYDDFFSHQAAAQKYLFDTGRQNCTVVNGRLLAQPQYEFTYECAQIKTALR